MACLVDENGSAVVLKNNVPRYLIVEFSKAEAEQNASDEDVLSVSKRLIANNRSAFCLEIVYKATMDYGY